MESKNGHVNRESTTPFLLKLFCRTGSFHRADEFQARNLPAHVQVHTWENCTLAELSHHIAAAEVDPPLLPNPAIGTRLAFRLVYPDTQGVSGGHAGAGDSSRARYVVRDLGSVVIGDGGPGILLSDDGGGGSDDLQQQQNREEEEEGKGDHNGRAAALRAMAKGDAAKTLADCKFVVGDYVSCAILPPLASNGVSQSAAAALRMGRGAGSGEIRSSMGVLPPPFRRDAPAGERARGGGGPDRYGREPRRSSGPYRDSGQGSGLPDGEWRRGERLPEGHGSRGRGRGRW